MPVASEPSHLRARMVDGTARLFLAESLLVPTGLLTVAYLTRRLGPSDYGRYTLAVALINWLEYAFSAPFSRAAVRIVSAASDWLPVGAVVVRTQLLVGVIAAVALSIAAPLVAAALSEPALTTILRLFSLDIPLFGLAQAHQQILIGLGRFRSRALLSAARWIIRLALIVAAVEAGLAIHGVVLAVVATSACEVVLVRCYVRPPIFGRSEVPVRDLFDYAIPLLATALCLRIFDRLDVVLLRYLGRSAAEVGMYGAAQNLTLATGIFAVAFAPILLSTVTQALRDRDLAHARHIARDSLRLVVLILPLAVILAASAREIVELLFGPQYLLSARVFQWLIFAGLGSVAVSASIAILTAAGRPGWTLGVAIPLPGVAVVAQAWAIPRYGPVGAAIVTTLCAAAGALIGFAVVYRMWQIAPPAMSLLRSVLIAAAGAVAATAWPAAGLFVILKLATLCAAALWLLAVSGEFGDLKSLVADSIPRRFGS